jgi:hypothetical protein
LSSERRFHCVPLLDEEDEVGGAAADLEVLGLHDGRHGVAALAQTRAVHAVAIVAEHHRPHDAAGVLRAHVELFAERGERHFQILDQRIDSFCPSKVFSCEPFMVCLVR